jgi:hypothetical protein
MRILLVAGCANRDYGAGGKLQINQPYPETKTNPIYWDQLSRFHLKTETESSVKKVVLNKRQDDG